ncbi:hypothetical protein CFC21_064068 [Triticum aestivum]|uniref:Lipoxygenase n=2 Tax=Triticum aestivum TaxID=4565 RepID=A0A9R1H1L9_WHEAT|nr:hypothetical protein CFC21_064068 [Triticum aestivum]
MVRGGAATRARAPCLPVLQADPYGAQRREDLSRSPTAARPATTPTTQAAGAATTGEAPWCNGDHGQSPLEAPHKSVNGQPNVSSARRAVPVPEACRTLSNARHTVSTVGCTVTVTATTITTTTLAEVDTVAHRAAPRGFNLTLSNIKMKATVTVHMKKEREDPVSSYCKYSGTGADEEFYTYEATFTVPASFAPIGAVRVVNDQNTEMLLARRGKHLPRRPGPGVVQRYVIPLQLVSWIHPSHSSHDKRTFFPVTQLPSCLRVVHYSYLPSQTPEGMKRLRSSELLAIRGDGTGERKPHQRIYDYDVYNDLGNKRPVLGGEKRPYPRRCRTGRRHYKQDAASDAPSEMRATDKIYVPRDEAFTEIKDAAFIRELVYFVRGTRGLHAQVQGYERPQEPQEPSQSQPHTQAEIVGVMIGFVVDELEHLLHGAHLCEEIRRFLKFETPEIHDKDKFAWFRDEEFARQTLAGMNPLSIQLVTELRIVSKLDGPSLITKELIEEQINGVMTAEEAMSKKKLFMLDYHDMFLPFVHKLAKSHVLAHDTGYHQLVSHWLRTHGCVEPYIIAANRQLSRMHPVYQLLHPHFRYTMEINAQARQMLIDAGGIIESTFSTGRYCMELSSVVYDKFWRFVMEALPEDLIRRGMAIRREDGKLGLAIEDYPYANDGLMVWDAIKQWASDYVKCYYSCAEDIIDDQELQGWWTEVRTKGHEDKKDEPWWPVLDSHESLVQVLAAIMWVTSAHHAAVNFGQYPMAGYIPNRPTTTRKNMPPEMGGPDSKEMRAFLEEPERVLLDTFPSQYQSVVVMLVLNLLSSHSPDEEYMGTYQELVWSKEEKIKEAFDRLKSKMIDIAAQIDTGIEGFPV